MLKKCWKTTTVLYLLCLQSKKGSTRQFYVEVFIFRGKKKILLSTALAHQLAASYVPAMTKNCIHFNCKQRETNALNMRLNVYYVHKTDFLSIVHICKFFLVLVGWLEAVCARERCTKKEVEICRMSTFLWLA